MEHAAQLAPNHSLLAQLHAEKCFFSLFLLLNAQIKENAWLANSLQTLSVRKPALPTSMCLSKSLCLPSMHSELRDLRHAQQNKSIGPQGQAQLKRGSLSAKMSSPDFEETPAEQDQASCRCHSDSCYSIVMDTTASSYT